MNLPVNLPVWLTSAGARKIGLAVLSGILLISIFPKWDIEILAWIAFVPLFLAIKDASVRDSFWLGWLTGVVYFSGTLYWVTVTMVTYGGLSQPLSVLLLLLLVVYLSLYLGFFCFFVCLLQRRTILHLVVTAPIIWVGLEYLRSFFFIGFPWNSLGYSQYLTPYVTQIADMTSVYGVSFVILLVNAALYTVALSEHSQAIKVRTAIAALCCMGGCLGYGAVVLSSASVEEQDTINVTVVQGNIDQGQKWNPELREHIVKKYAELSESALKDSPDLIVWPETSVPYVITYDPNAHKRIMMLVRKLQTGLLFGAIDLIPASDAKGYNSLNSAFLFSAEGETIGKYDKIHLVPFGEYVPFEHFLFFIDRITTAIGQVRPGNSYDVMRFKQIPLSTVICFEAIFPNLVRKFVDRGAGVLINITNDAWFGTTSASYQHFAMVTFRAIENRTAIARSANTGISGFIDPYGRILAQSELFVDDALTHTLPVRTTTTFYTRYGDVFAKFCFALSLCWIGFVFFKNYRNQM